jgi:hypothetical protein
MSSFYSFLLSQLSIFLHSLGIVWGVVWWIVIPIVSIIVFWEFWMLYINLQWLSSIKWAILEIRIPKNVLKTPKAMEQVFAAAHATHSTFTFMEKYWKGVKDAFMSFEIVGRAGESHFYLRLPEKFRNLMESAIYAQYPEAEIIETENYVAQMPKIIPNKELDLYGGEWILASPNCYPIRTYPKFEEAVEEQRIDTTALIMENMAKLKDNEQIWIQFIIRPVSHEWKKEGEEMINKLLGIETPKKKSWLSDFQWLGFTFKELLAAPFVHPDQEVKRKEEATNFRLLLSNPSMKDVVDGIREKITKTSFETTVRFICIDRRETFKGDNVSAVVGFLKQFGTQTMNAFRPDMKTWPNVVGLFKKRRVAWRKRLIYERYRDMSFTPFKKQSILNVEELATVYHFPIATVGTTELEKIPSRKGGPPASLPTIEE